MGSICGGHSTQAARGLCGTPSPSGGCTARSLVAAGRDGGCCGVPLGAAANPVIRRMGSASEGGVWKRRGMGCAVRTRGAAMSAASPGRARVKKAPCRCRVRTRARRQRGEGHRCGSCGWRGWAGVAGAGGVYRGRRICRDRVAGMRGGGACHGLGEAEAVVSQRTRPGPYGRFAQHGAVVRQRGSPPPRQLGRACRELPGRMVAA
jgi:hypothetical protein